MKNSKKPRLVLVGIRRKGERVFRIQSLPIIANPAADARLVQQERLA